MTDLFAIASPRAGRRLRGTAAAALSCAALLALPACAYRPVTDADPAVRDVPARWSGDAVQAADGSGLADWWLRFGDAELSDLVDEALEASPSVQAALAVLRQSRAQLEVTGAGLLPSLDASVSAQSSRSAGQSATKRFGAGLDAGWELDLSGATRAGIAAAEFDAHAAGMQVAEVRVSLAAEVALAWIEWRDLQTRLEIARDNLAAQDDTRQIADWRHQAGLVAALDVEQAITAVEQLRAQLPLLEASLAQARHRLAVLTGRTPDGLAGLIAAPVPLPPDELVLTFPADTLRQRPDVRQAETQVQAARARVAQASAAHWPSLRLSGSLGLQAATVGGLSGGGASVRSALAGLSLPLFEGGAISARVRAQQAALDQAHANYRGVVLTALQEVEDALAALAGERARSASLQAAATAAATAATLASQQYEAGLVAFDTVLQAQRTRLSAEDSVASAHASLAADYVRLYKALGGGWTPQPAKPLTSLRSPPPAAPMEASPT